MAAWLILHVASERPGAVEDRRVTFKSARLMIDALQGSDAEQRLWSCIFMTAGCVPKEAVAVLCDILEEADDRLKILAAAALTWCGDESALALPILGPALGNENDTLVVIAATAFGRLGMRPAAVQEIISVFPTVQPTAQFHILQSLKQIGSPALAAANMLGQYIEDPKNLPFLRTSTQPRWEASLGEPTMDYRRSETLCVRQSGK